MLKTFSRSPDPPSFPFSYTVSPPVLSPSLSSLPFLLETLPLAGITVSLLNITRRWCISNYFDAASNISAKQPPLQILTTPIQCHIPNLIWIRGQAMLDSSICVCALVYVCARVVPPVKMNRIPFFLLIWRKEHFAFSHMRIITSLVWEISFWL